MHPFHGCRHLSFFMLLLCYHLSWSSHEQMATSQKQVVLSYAAPAVIGPCKPHLLRFVIRIRMCII
jgi:hypothetical protein